MPSLVATSTPCSFSGGLDVLGEARAVDLLVVQDRRVRAAVLRHHGGQSGALDGVLGHDPQVVARAGRVVLVGLALLGAGLVRGQAHGGVRRADLGDRHLVQDRDRDRARARVELADVGDRVLVLRHPARVGRGGLGRPVAGLGGRVVERGVLHRRLAGLAAGLLERQLDPVHQRQGLEALRPLEGQRRVHVDRAGAALTGLVAIVVVVSAGREAREQDQGRRQAGQHGATLHSLSHLDCTERVEPAGPSSKSDSCWHRSQRALNRLKLASMIAVGRLKGCR